MWLVIKPFLPMIARLAAIIGVVLALVWAWNHFVADPYIARGVAQQALVTGKEKLRADVAEAANKTLQADVETFRRRVGEQDASIAAWKATSDKYQEMARVLLTAAAGRDALAVKEIRKLQDLISKPSPTKEKACEAATSTLGGLADYRLRDDKVAAPGVGSPVK